MPKMCMRTGEGFNISTRLVRALHHIALTGLFLCFSVSIQAIDNPDAPDYVDDFLKRAQVNERDIHQTTHTTQQYVTAYAAYEDFLDKELNAAYRQLMAQLSQESQQVLKKSQHAWLNYRDQEFEFISHNWTAEKFGSSMVISRGDYRAKIIKNRVMLLLRYLGNY